MKTEKGTVKKQPLPTPPPAEPRFVRFDFKPGATPEEVAEALKKLVEQHSAPKKRSKRQ